MGAIGALIPIYTAGLNAGTPEKATTSFLAFTLIMLYCGLITLLPFWKTHPFGSGPKQVSEKTRILSAFRLGIASAIALFFAEIWNFSKLGWASSAVGSVVRPEEVDNKSRKRAVIRAAAVVVGGLIASIILVLLSPSLHQIAIIVVTLTVINGLISLSPLGQMPVIYNAVILLLYSSTAGTNFSAMRVTYNLFGIVVALFIVYYPMPHITKRVEAFFADKNDNLVEAK